tara:strand:- start:34105 stop:34323 length:219 start_codon:yes stop_codon:yes gene_type:complete
MKALINDIKELPSFYKALAVLLAAISYILVPPVLNDLGYFQAFADWVPIALGGFLSALVLGCLIGKWTDESE